MSVSNRVEASRPSKLYFYADRVTAERALQAGEFRLRPNSYGEPLTSTSAASQILPFGAPRALPAASFLTLSLSTALSEKLFQQDQAAPCCVIIHNTEEFGERIHRAVQKALPQWAGIDAAVAYGAPSPLGAAFTKGRHLAGQKEWLFAWRPIQTMLSMNPIVVRIGSIDAFAELREQNTVGPA
ncbi:hypothetical protein [Actimicrobium antarcticum]|uniref:Uncharacterized protein n=1 Tax=Actimicrobium antarcticum TaxID=1051899 RepID=A0ABP7T2I8_9BURK